MRLEIERNDDCGGNDEIDGNKAFDMDDLLVE